ncbi:MAG: hypothetical protein ACLFUQ_03605 [Candidatus Izemoplasmataceae bacterium]
MMHKAHRIIGVLVLGLGVLTLAACESGLEKDLSRVQKTENYSMTLTLHELDEGEDVTITYSQDGDVLYYDIKFLEMRESYYDVESEEGYDRYSKSNGQWNRSSTDPEEDPLIQPDSVYLRPLALSEALFESADDDDTYRLKEEAYEDLFGTKAEAVQNVRLTNTDGTIGFEYAFTQNTRTIEVSGIIDDIDETEITLPFE